MTQERQEIPHWLRKTVSHKIIFYFLRRYKIIFCFNSIYSMLLNDHTNKHPECCFDLCNFDREVAEWCSRMISHKESSIWASDQETENLMVQWAINLLNYTITELMFLLLYLRIWHDNSLKSDVLGLWHPLTCTVIHKKEKEMRWAWKEQCSHQFPTKLYLMLFENTPIHLVTVMCREQH